MSYIHDNEKPLAKKAQFVKMQKYVKTSHYYAALYIVIVTIQIYSCHFTENWNMSQTASYILLQPRIETGIVPTKEKTIQNVDLIIHVLHKKKKLAGCTKY